MSVLRGGYEECEGFVEVGFALVEESGGEAIGEVILGERIRTVSKTL
jgi:hypothetical protein